MFKRTRLTMRLVALSEPSLDRRNHTLNTGTHPLTGCPDRPLPPCRTTAVSTGLPHFVARQHSPRSLQSTNPMLISSLTQYALSPHDATSFIDTGWLWYGLVL